MKRTIFIVIIIICIVCGIIFYHSQKRVVSSIQTTIQKVAAPLNPLSIAAMRARSYPGSNLKIEQTLSDGSNYHQYIASYISDGLKINGLLTIPIGTKPKAGWPVILFNHGYISPGEYQTDPSVGQYASYFSVFAEAGYIVFKPDYRGNAQSEGKPEGAYYSPAYTVDDLNALSSLKKYPDANPNKIGVWGHSMGGNITLRDLVVNPNDIKAAVIWGGVVGSYEDLAHWHDPAYHPSITQSAAQNRVRSALMKQYGSPSSHSPFWQSIDPTNFVSSITVPVQLDVGGSDEEVPSSFSQNFRDKLQKAGKTVEFFTYPGDNHNISNHFTEAMQHSLDFFNKYLK